MPSSQGRDPIPRPNASEQLLFSVTVRRRGWTEYVHGDWLKLEPKTCKGLDGLCGGCKTAISKNLTVWCCARSRELHTIFFVLEKLPSCKNHNLKKKRKGLRLAPRG